MESMKCQILRPYYDYRKELTESPVMKIISKDGKKINIYNALIQEKINRVDKIIKILEEGLLSNDECIDVGEDNQNFKEYILICHECKKELTEGEIEYKFDSGEVLCHDCALPF
jgi:hypothetical protein